METSSLKKTKAYDWETGSALVKAAMASIPADSYIYVDTSIAIADRIRAIMVAKKIKAITLAERAGKTKAEVSRWLSGTHNFTMRTLAKLEAALGEPILVVTGPPRPHWSENTPFQQKPESTPESTQD
jgi:DNA-binding Xre family transcriptional regulator